MYQIFILMILIKIVKYILMIMVIFYFKIEIYQKKIKKKNIKVYNIYKIFYKKLEIYVKQYIMEFQFKILLIKINKKNE